MPVAISFISEYLFVRYRAYLHTHDHLFLYDNLKCKSSCNFQLCLCISENNCSYLRHTHQHLLQHIPVHHLLVDSQNDKSRNNHRFHSHICEHNYHYLQHIHQYLMYCDNNAIIICNSYAYHTIIVFMIPCHR